jgi:hypothetical protein
MYPPGREVVRLVGNRLIDFFSIHAVQPVQNVPVVQAPSLLSPAYRGDVRGGKKLERGLAETPT